MTMTLTQIPKHTNTPLNLGQQEGLPAPIDPGAAGVSADAYGN